MISTWKPSVLRGPSNSHQISSLESLWFMMIKLFHVFCYLNLIDLINSSTCYLDLIPLEGSLTQYFHSEELVWTFHMEI